MRSLILYAALTTLVFQESYGFVVVASNNSSEEPASLCIGENGENLVGTIGFKDDCRKFVQCGPGVELVIACQSGLLFNEATKQCDWPRQANCVEYRAKDNSKPIIPVSEIQW